MSQEQLSPQPTPAPQVTAHAHQTMPITKVVVIDFDMSFSHMVGFMIKAAIAAIPAMIVLIFIGTLVVGILGGMYGISRSS